MIEPPRLTAKEMAEFAMRDTHLESYQRSLLLHVKLINGREYAIEVKNFMNEIFEKRKGKK